MLAISETTFYYSVRPIFPGTFISIAIIAQSIQQSLWVLKFKWTQIQTGNLGSG